MLSEHFEVDEVVSEKLHLRDLGRLLKGMRHSQGTSQQCLAEQVDCSHQLVSKIEKGEVRQALNLDYFLRLVRPIKGRIPDSTLRHVCGHAAGYLEAEDLDRLIGPMAEARQLVCLYKHHDHFGSVPGVCASCKSQLFCGCSGHTCFVCKRGEIRVLRSERVLADLCRVDRRRRPSSV